MDINYNKVSLNSFSSTIYGMYEFKENGWTKKKNVKIQALTF